jgi:hypothetical protein
MNNKHYDVVFHYKKTHKSKTQKRKKEAKKLIKMTHFISISVPLIRSVPHPLPHFNLMEWSFFMGGGGGLEMGGGANKVLPL